MASILVAEDERDVRDLIIFTLRFAGHEIRGAVNGEELLRLAKESVPDLILMDVRIPEMNGLEPCKILKENKDTSSIPVILIYAWGQEVNVKSDCTAGGADYIFKPISPDQLTEKVRKSLKKSGK